MVIRVRRGKEIVTIAHKVLGSAAPVAMLLLAACTGEEPAGPPPDAGALVAAAAAGDADEVRRLLRAGADPDEADADRRTAVTHAAYGGHAEAVRVLLEAGADVDRQDATRANPLLSTGETGFSTFSRRSSGPIRTSRARIASAARRSSRLRTAATWRPCVACSRPTSTSTT